MDERTPPPPHSPDPAPDAAPAGPPPLPLQVAPPGGPLRALRQLATPVLAVLALLLLVGLGLGGTAVWLLRSAEGTAWLLQRLPDVQARGLEGALLSERFAAEHLELRWGNGEAGLVIEGLQASGLQWRWHPEASALLGLQAAQIEARRVLWISGPPSNEPPALPRSLRYPLRLQVQQLDVGELQFGTDTPLRALQARGLRLWAPEGREFHVDTLAFEWDRIQVQASATLGTRQPYPLQASATVAASADPGREPAWSAQARASGPLARFDLQATLRGVARRSQPPSLDAQATIQPLQAWPLGRLRLQTRALDLSELHSQAPRTALAGRIDIDSESLTGPLGAEIALDNGQPGRWDEGRVPVQRLAARLRSPDADRGRLLIESFDLLLARAGSKGIESAGRWQGRGEWQGPQLQIDSRIDTLRPQQLDSRAPGMTLSGPLAFTVSGLPSPDPGAAPPARAPAPAVAVHTTLDGQLDTSPQGVKLRIDGSADAQHVELRELHAEAGPARATLTLDARRARANTPWQVRSNGTLADFDPQPWWPGSDLPALRAGPHRFSGTWALDLTLPRASASTNTDTSALTLAQGIVGSGTLNLQRSLLAGVPLQLQLELAQRRSADGGPPSSMQGELLLGGNRLVLSGEGNPLGDGRQDQLRFDLQAGTLATLAPLTRLAPGLQGWEPRSGSAQASGQFEGRWPDIRSAGKASVQGLQLGTLPASAVQAGQLQAEWRVDTSADEPLQIKAVAQAVRRGEQRLDDLKAELNGTLRQHRLELSAALPMNPPAALQTVLGLQTTAGTQALLRADGRWSPDGSGGGRWAGRVDQLLVTPAAGRSGAVPAGPGSTWFEARDLRAELRVDGRDGLAELQAAAGQVRLAEAITLRWDEVRADLRGAFPAYTLRADIEPFALAPLLARTQPTMGWAGDLRLAARVDLRVGEKIDADVLFERRDGDLRLSEEAGTVPFGLSELRIVGSAHEGHWQLAGSFAGQALGEASARLNLRVPAGQRWPGTDTPIDGLIDAHVANLGIWSTWVPPGWRLAGDLRTRATVRGTVGAPDYSGQIDAQQVAVRNLLQGVDVQGGQVRVLLEGATARIERFTLRGGDGEITVTGGAQLTGTPSAKLQLEARRFRVLGRVDRQLVASGQLALGLGAEALVAEGRIHIDEGLFDLGANDAPSLDDDVTIRQAGPAWTQKDEAQNGQQRPRREQRVNIELDLGDKLHVRGRGLDAMLGGKLRLGSSAGRLTAHGVISTANGTYAAYGQKLDIERALITFNGALDSPTLDVLAIRPDLDTQVGVAITGSLPQPRVRLYASEDMSESDKLSWLVLGRASDGLGRADTALLQRAAVALLAGEGEGPTDALMRNLGIDQLSLRQSEGDTRDTVVTLGKQLSRRWYVGYERGVNATTGTWQLIYRIAQRFTLRAQSGLENSLDLIWVWRIDDRPTSTAASASQPAPSNTPRPMPQSAASAPP